MKKIKGFICVSLMFFAGVAACTEIYKWKDSSGVIHYGDTPQPGAQIIEIPGIQSPATAPANETPSANNQPTPEATKQGYENVVIKKPVNQATIRNNQGYLLVNAEVTPELKAGDLLQIVIDGNPFGTPQASGSFAISNINRGAHTLVVQVVDKKGDVLISSDSVQFFMHQARVNMIPSKGARNP